MPLMNIPLSSTLGAFACVAALSSGAFVNDAKEPAPLQDRVAKCGLGKEFHAGRRAELARRLKDGVFVARGLTTPRENEMFHQDKTFWYLTGVASRDAALVIDVKANKSILFLPEANRRLAFTESWDGEIWDTGDDWVPGLTGIDDIRPNDELLATLEELTKESKKLWISKHPVIELKGSYDTAAKHNNTVRADDLDGRLPREEAFAKKLEDALDGVEIEDCRFELIEMRLHKTPEEQVAMRNASHTGALALEEAIRSTRPGLGEWELDGLITFMHTQLGATGPGYDAIVGSGPNSLVLHYLHSGRVLRPGEVVLIDYAPEYDHYVSDITRTWPTDGNWTHRMAELYDAVLDAQAAGIAACRPGVTIREIDAACDKALRSKGYGDLMKHGACHFIGMEVHDPDYTMSEVELQPGACFTIEPGLYEKETNIGIRIEDVVMITEGGCEVLSKAVTKDRGELTKLIAEEGILDRKGSRPLSDGSE